MILRSVATRHGRRALATPLHRTCTRFNTTSSEIDSSQTSSLESNLNRVDAAQISTPPQTSDVASDYKAFKQIQKTTGKLGSIVDKAYQPSMLVNQPYFPRDVTLELLMASQAHIGHSTSLWNPANQRYIYGIRQGVHILSLETTAAHLRRAAKVVEGVAYHGGLILFIGTRPGQSRCVVKAAELSKGYHLFESWTPGSITNGDQILAACRIKVVNEKDEELTSEVIAEKIEDYRSLKPDLVVCLNPLENYIALHECSLYNIPTIGIIDTDADPTWVTYPIPANDDSLRCVQLIAGVLGRAGESGQKKRLEAAATGKVTWETPQAVRDWAQEQQELDKKRHAERLKALNPNTEGKPLKLARTKEELLKLDHEVEPVV